MLLFKANKALSKVESWRPGRLERRLLSFVSETAVGRQVVFRARALIANQTKADNVRQGNQRTGGCTLQGTRVKKEKKGKKQKASVGFISRA